MLVGIAHELTAMTIIYQKNGDVLVEYKPPILSLEKKLTTRYIF